MQPETDAPMDLQQGGETFRNRVISPLMFRSYMLVKMPVLGVTGAYLSQIDTRRTEIFLPYSWTTKNLFGRMFDSAVSAAAETVSLSLLVLHIRNQETDLTAELAEMACEVHRTVEEDLQLRCQDGYRYADFVNRAVDTAPMTKSFEVVADTASGRPTHEFEFTWRLREK